MIQIESVADLELLQETVDLECKLAAGRDGKGALPSDFWPTYSAFANTNGGTVVLGAREKQGRFVIEGVPHVANVRRDLFNLLNSELVKSDSAHLVGSFAHLKGCSTP